MNKLLSRSCRRPLAHRGRKSMSQNMEVGADPEMSVNKEAVKDRVSPCHPSWLCRADDDKSEAFSCRHVQKKKSWNPLMSNLRLKPTSALYMWMWWLVSGAEVERCRWRPTETDFTPDTNPWWGNHQPAVKSALLGKITAEVQPPALPALQNECLGITDPLFSLLSRGAQRKGKCILKPTALIFVWILLPSAESVFRSAATEQDLWRDLTGIAEQDGGGILQVCFWKTPAVSQYFQWCYHSKEFRMC